MSNIPPKYPEVSPALKSFVARSPNNLLTSLNESDLALLGPYLRIVELTHEAVLATAGQELARVYFPHSGVISLVVSLADGTTVEVAMVGRDSVFGVSAALDGRIALNDAIVQLPGVASCIDVDRLRTAADQSATLRAILIRHQLALFAQAQQSAACNASHPVEARLSKWLLRMRDLSGGERLEITQEFLSQMIGVQRNSVSLVVNQLKQEGIVQHRRGVIEIVNVDALKARACECYTAVKLQYDRLLKVEKD